eukprot:m.362587 g.362587  ORF g.362587 m.362587 type:complete len:509 (-) comp28064_c1_seq3:838-2364(-)
MSSRLPPLLRVATARSLCKRHSSTTTQASSSELSFDAKVQQLAQKAAAGDFCRRDPVPDAGGGKTVLLLHPPGACSAYTRSGSQYPPLGLNLLKAVIGDRRRVDLLEADGGYLTDEATAKQIYDAAPKAVGMTVTCGTKPLVHAWSTVVKNLFPAPFRPLVIVGGPATAFEAPAIFADCPNVDVIVKGDGEVHFPEIVNILEREHGTVPRPTEYGGGASYSPEALELLGALPGVMVRAAPPNFNDSFIPQFTDFDRLPFPDLDDSPVSRYQAPDALRLPMVTMITQRGCVAKCTFCNTPQKDGSRIRGWSSEQIVDQLQHLKDRHGIREVSFVDDVFTNRPGGPRKLCRMMEERRLDLTWYCNARADAITSKMARAMRSAGCHQVFLGFESGCDDMLLRIKKGETVGQLEHGAQLLKDNGIRISVGFIVGLPGETQETVDKSIALCNRVQPDRVQFTRFTPIPGSALASGSSSAVSPGSSGFHNREADDKVERWLRQCYQECVYAPSV